MNAYKSADNFSDGRLTKVINYGNGAVEYLRNKKNGLPIIGNRQQQDINAMAAACATQPTQPQKQITMGEKGNEYTLEQIKVDNSPTTQPLKPMTMDQKIGEYTMEQTTNNINNNL